MKKVFLVAALYVSVFATSFAQGHVRNKSNEFFQVGYENYKALTFGKENLDPNNGKFAIEYINGGLNIWKPWPTWNHANYIMRLSDSHNVSIGGFGSSLYRLYVYGNVKIQGTITTTSDERLKKNINPLESMLSKIMQVRTVSYQMDISQDKYAGDAGNLPDTEAKRKTRESDATITAHDDKTHIGFLAQDLQKYFPELVEQDGNGDLGVRYSEMIPVLLKAIQVQQAQIDELKKIIDELKK